MAIKITQRAIDKVVEALGKSEERNSKFLRMGVSGEGCSGLSYILEFEDVVNPADISGGREKVLSSARPCEESGQNAAFEVFEPEQFRKNFPSETPQALPFPVVINAKSFLYLNGVTLDWVADGLAGGFTFTNPNAKSGCGCGHSFSA